MFILLLILEISCLVGSEYDRSYALKGPALRALGSTGPQGNRMLPRILVKFCYGL